MNTKTIIALTATMVLALASTFVGAAEVPRHGKIERQANGRIAIKFDVPICFSVRASEGTTYNLMTPAGRSLAPPYLLGDRLFANRVLASQIIVIPLNSWLPCVSAAGVTGVYLTQISANEIVDESDHQ